MTYLSEQLADSPLGAWMLNDAAGASVMTDSSGNSRNGSYSQVGLGLVPIIGSATAGEFNGGSICKGNVSAASWMNVTNVTVESVIRPYRVDTALPIIGRESTTTANRTLQFTVSASGKLQFIFWDAAGTLRTVTGATNVSRYAIAHAAATYDGSNAYVYLNGTQDGSLAVASTLRASALVNLTVGFLDVSTAPSWVGQLAGVGFYGSALSPTRIAAHAAARGSSNWNGSGTWGLVS